MDVLQKIKKVIEEIQQGSEKQLYEVQTSITQLITSDLKQITQEQKQQFTHFISYCSEIQANLLTSLKNYHFQEESAQELIPVLTTDLQRVLISTISLKTLIKQRPSLIDHSLHYQDFQRLLLSLCQSQSLLTKVLERISQDNPDISGSMLGLNIESCVLFHNQFLLTVLTDPSLQQGSFQEVQRYLIEDLFLNKIIQDQASGQKKLIEQHPSESFVRERDLNKQGKSVLGCPLTELLVLINVCQNVKSLGYFLELLLVLLQKAIQHFGQIEEEIIFDFMNLVVKEKLFDCLNAKLNNSLPVMTPQSNCGDKNQQSQDSQSEAIGSLLLSILSFISTSLPYEGVISDMLDSPIFKKIITFSSQEIHNNYYQQCNPGSILNQDNKEDLIWEDITTALINCTYQLLHQKHILNLSDFDCIIKWVVLIFKNFPINKEQTVNSYKLSNNDILKLLVSLTHLLQDVQNCFTSVTYLFPFIVEQLIQNHVYLGSVKSLEQSQIQQVKIQSGLYFYCLRLLYSIPFQRNWFKMVLPTPIYMTLIDIEKVNKDQSVYNNIVEKFLRLSSQDVHNIMIQNAEYQQNEGIQSQYYFNNGPSGALNAGKEDKCSGVMFSVSGYKVLKIIGQGANGKVYLAVKDNKKYALKELQVDEFSKVQLDKAILKEVHILSRLKHPNIIQLYEAFQKRKYLYFATEYIEGLNLLEYLQALEERDKGFNKKDLIKLILDLLNSVFYLHNKAGVIHNDLNPSNIMITFDKTLKITDFGLSQLSKQKSTQKLSSNLSKESLNRNSIPDQFAGTLPYCAPEMIDNEQSSDKSDVWAVGCIIYELLVMQPAFMDKNPLIMAKKISQGDYQKLEEILLYNFNKDLEKKLVKIVKGCLEVDLEKRMNVKDIVRELIDEYMQYLDDLKVKQEGN